MTELIWSVRFSLDANHWPLGLWLHFTEDLWICWGSKRTQAVVRYTVNKDCGFDLISNVSTFTEYNHGG